MKQCVACDSPLAESAKFCVRCGISQDSSNLIGGSKAKKPQIDEVPVSVQELPLFTGRENKKVASETGLREKQPRIPVETPQKEPRPPREPLSGRIKVLMAGSLVVLLGLVGIFVANTSPVSLNQAFKGDELKVFASASCTVLERAIEPPISFETYDGRLKALKKQTKARSAQKYVKNRTWVNEDFAEPYKASVKSSIEDVVNGKIATLRISPDRIDVAEWVAEFTPLVLETCGLQSDFDDTVDALEDLDNQADRVVALAATAPWYPEGYEEISVNSNLAYKNGGGGNCGYFAESCASFRVVAKTACSMLYIEAADQRGGAQLSTSSDIKYSVKAMKTTRWVIDFYTNGSAYEITTATCS